MKASHLIINLSLLILFGCAPESSVPESTDKNLIQLKGTLFFKLIDIPNLYGYSEEKCEELLTKFRGSISKKHTDTSDFISTYWNKLEEHNLLLKPIFKLQNDSIEFINVFLEEDQYRKIKNLKLHELQEEKKKVNIVVAGELLDQNIFKCHEIISVEKVNGKTPWQK